MQNFHLTFYLKEGILFMIWHFKIQQENKMNENLNEIMCWNIFKNLSWNLN